MPKKARVARSSASLSGRAANQHARRHYLELLERLRRTRKRAEQARITEELRRLTFGD